MREDIGWVYREMLCSGCQLFRGYSTVILLGGLGNRAKYKFDPDRFPADKFYVTYGIKR